MRSMGVCQACLRPRRVCLLAVAVPGAQGTWGTCACAGRGCSRSRPKSMEPVRWSWFNDAAGAELQDTAWVTSDLYVLCQTVGLASGDALAPDDNAAQLSMS
jgi:hypothetical protein